MWIVAATKVSLCRRVISVCNQKAVSIWKADSEILLSVMV
jgi:hypothetical protein